MFNRFLAYCDKNNITYLDAINKKNCVEYLESIKSKSSYNNSLANLKACFNQLVEKEKVADNFFNSIKKIKVKPTKNKTFTPDQLDLINKELEQDQQLKLFIDFVSYNFLRPVEVCRLQVKDINAKDRLMYFQSKTKQLKKKIIPNVIELPNLDNLPPNAYIFTSQGITETTATSQNRRGYFSKRFLKIKQKLNLSKEYNIYSFRHTFITKIYQKLREEKSPSIAKSDLMLITGHTSINALDKYLRDIDAELPLDYSNLFD